jgi:hypothetical protein
VLTPGKKPVWIFMYSFLTGEQSALDSEATTFGITTEKTNYDTAVSALTTYLATLTTPVAWNNLTGNTTIVGTTFRTKFNDVLVDKQALLNKMHDASLALANTAQTTANTATTNAATAQTTADNVNKNDKNTASATIPTSILTATDAGSDVTIGVLGHDRQYGDGTSVTLNAVVVGGHGPCLLNALRRLLRRHGIYRRNQDLPRDDDAQDRSAGEGQRAALLRADYHAGSPGRSGYGRRRSPAIWQRSVSMIRASVEDAERINDWVWRDSGKRPDFTPFLHDPMNVCPDRGQWRRAVRLARPRNLRSACDVRAARAGGYRPFARFAGPHAPRI